MQSRGFENPSLIAADTAGIVSLLGQKAPRRFRLVTVFELPATSQRPVPVWWLFEVFLRGSMGSKSFAVSCVAIAVLCVGTAFPSFARTASPCALTPGEAAVQVKNILAAPQEVFMTDRDRAALVCLAEAVAALDARINAPSTDAETVEGPIHAPQGIIITQPPASEGE